jgi:hypothetical protein
MPIAQSVISTRRADARAARTARLAKLDALEAARRALVEAQRSFAPGRPDGALEKAQQLVTTATGEYETARAAEEAARATLSAGIDDWLVRSLAPDGVTKQYVTVDEDLTRLSTRNALVLLPVRIETRFGQENGAAVLKVRVYPDEIFLDLHEPALTREEVEAGQQYFLNVRAGATASEQWKALSGLLGPARAAYVARLLDPHDPEGDITFPDVDLRPADWTRPGEAVLPDRWVVVTESAAGVRSTTGLPIPEPLVITVGPGTEGQVLVDVGGGPKPLQIDRRLLWTLSYDEAKRIGMAVSVPLQGTEPTAGLDRVLVYGVKSSMAAKETALHLERLMDGHHYTRGLAMVPQGAPTNNTEGAPSPFPRDDPAADFQDERVPAPFYPDHSVSVLPQAVDGEAFRAPDAVPLARALGVPDGVLANVTGSRGQEQAHAGDLNDVLWPAMFEYFLQHITDGRVAAPRRKLAREYFTSYVRARGPAPALRVGSVPYGVLPVVSLQRWAPFPISPSLPDAAKHTDQQLLEQDMLATLRLLRDLWNQAALTRAPRVRRASTRPIEELMESLALQPAAREVRARTAQGSQTWFHFAQMLSASWASIVARIDAAALPTLAKVGLSTWAGTRLARMVFGPRASLFAGPLVAPPEIVSEAQLLDAGGQPNYLLVLSKATQIDPLLKDTLAVGTGAGTLLYRLARQSLLAEVGRRAVEKLGELTISFLWFEIELVGMANLTASNQTMGAVLLQPIGNVVTTPGAPGPLFGDFLLQGDAELARLKGRLDRLGKAPTAELERLLTETLDLGSHRLDAWLTALATRRLFQLRLTPPLTDAGFTEDRGSYLGGYAFVEDLRPGSATASGKPGGFIQAPSAAHGAAAAILRNAHLSYRAEDAQKYAFDLPSARVRAARALLDEVRAGQPLGAALGARFERRLHDDNPGLFLDRFVYNVLRPRFPLVVNKSGAPSAEPVEGLAARNVVDGLALWKMFTESRAAFDQLAGLPAAGSPERNAINAALGALTDEVDGLSDLTTAESVYQIARGNVTGGAANLDALSRGAHPPDPEIARSQRGGVGVTHRVVLAVRDGAATPGLPDATPAWPQDLTARAEAERFLDDWVGRMLGDPSLVRCRVTLTPRDPGDVAPPPTMEVTVSLADLSQARAVDTGGVVSFVRRILRPLDVVALARAVTVENQASSLDLRIGAFALAAHGDQVVQKIDYARVDPGALTFPEVMELARAAGELVAGGRALVPADLALPVRSTELQTSGALDRTGLVERVTAAGAALALARRALAEGTAGTLRERLESGSAFVPGAFPAPTASDAELDALAPAVVAELDRRLALLPAIDADRSVADVVADATAQLKTIFGQDFVAVAAFSAPGDSELGLSLGAEEALLGSDPAAPTRFFQQAAQVQPGLGRWRKLGMYLGALDRPRPPLHLAQLPFVPGERWVGLPFGGGPAVQPGRVSLAIYSTGAGPPDAGGSWRGLVLDEWVELVPAPFERTAVAFHHDAPGAEAPQAILVVPPSSAATAWSADEVRVTLEETLELAHARAVDAEMLSLGQVLPTIFLAQDAQAAPPAVDPPTLTTLLTGLLRKAIERAVG